MRELPLQRNDENCQSEEVEFTSIAQLRTTSRAVTTRFTVLSVEEPRVISSKNSRRQHLVTKAIVADESGRIDMILWNKDVDELRPEKTYILRGGYVSVYEECMQLNKGRSGSLKLIPKNLQGISRTPNMSKPFMGRQRRTKKRSRSRSGRTLGGIPGREKKGYCSSKGF
ncbi:MAG: hypothetical protein JSW61_07480 [Candidatus Thorarchaeota archaeon]|nr:MAG: hypothetical protein JSW61_07480 [Candidatus Thorarchaeota archaeon]